MAINLPNDPLARELLLLIERAKYERFVAGETSRLVERELNRIVDVVVSPRWRQLTPFQRQRHLDLFRELDRQVRSGYVSIADFQVREMKGYALFESEIGRAQVTAALTPRTPHYRAVVSAILPRHTLEAIAALPIDGLRISDWYQGQATTMTLTTRRIIQQGLIEGKGSFEIARRLVAEQATDGGPLVLRRMTHEARAIVRTTVTAVRAHAATESYRSLGDDVVEWWRFVAVRDARTTAVCRALDGRRFRVDDDTAPRPPRHINCRSTQVPEVLDENGKLIEASAPPHSFTTYDAWLRSQPESVQNQILGRQRAEWWRTGKLSLADTVDGDLRQITLDQLRERFENLREAAA